MEYLIGITDDNVSEYPLHRHTVCEIMHYIEGTGYLLFEDTRIPFSPGTIIIVPAGVVHGSKADPDGTFKNVSIRGCFESLFFLEQPMRIEDGEEEEGKQLINLIWNNRVSTSNFLSSLCTAYANYLLNRMQFFKNIDGTIHRIARSISENFSDPDFNLTALLNSTGYAEDYIRARFRENTSMTPLQYMRKVQIDHAIFLIEIYGGTLPISEIADRSGFSDFAYFSKCFKKTTGVSPSTYYKKSHVT